MRSDAGHNTTFMRLMLGRSTLTVMNPASQIVTSVRGIMAARYFIKVPLVLGTISTVFMPNTVATTGLDVRWYNSREMK